MNYIGVDVGTSSARACVVSDTGSILATCVEEITIWNPKSDFYQQSSTNIWNAVVRSIQRSLAESSVDPKSIKGIGFDATCSLVVLDENFLPLTVSIDGDKDQNIIMWMDHRAERQVGVINATAHPVLDTVGGTMSLEMQMPKLMWLKENLPDTWAKIGHLMDLPDFLTWKSTGSLSRSLCSTICKWGYDGGKGWSDDFLSLINLSDLVIDDHLKIGNQVQRPGTACGSGLLQEVAASLGLPANTPVGTSLIDAHAGALACLGCCPSGKTWTSEIENSLVIIAGTSTCHIICSKKGTFVPGVWGPYHSAILPEMWVNEGGQSATGKLMDFITFTHPSFSTIQELAKEKCVHPYDFLNQHIQDMANQTNLPSAAHLTQNVHIWPDFHGNRSPLADPSLKGMVCGLTLSSSLDDLAILYLAMVQALAYGTKHIVSEMERCGHVISSIYFCGGLRSNSLYMKTHSDVLGLPLILPDTEQSVLLGAAILGAAASGQFESLEEAMFSMGGQGQIIFPDNSDKRFHEKKYHVFLEMLKDQRKYQSLMKE
ncbi:FGGY carbohydrate kinase domain-containing protein-like [Physella acuta]|uniref:FGGY carbohydrate kinase domain-containing protein-like n=1 Tax=Physella acuta TaxID=109671 RepID=UPI0027DC29A2|nr:FGGY carbohydrate kinase domain-containing protein-like [Physella acuta]